MQTRESGQGPMISRTQALLSTLVVVCSGFASSLYGGWVLSHGENAMFPVLAYAAAANPHLMTLAAIFTLRSADHVRLRTLRPALIIFAVVIGVAAAAGFRDMHPASPAIGMLFGGFAAAIGPLWVGWGLIPPRRALADDHEIVTTPAE